MAVFVCLSALLLCTSSVRAASLNELSDDGNASVTVVPKGMDGKDVSLKGMEFTLFKTADLAAQDGALVPTVTESFSPVLTLDDLQAGKKAKEAAQYALDHEVEGKTLTAADNSPLVFDNLGWGHYLVVNTKSASGYNACEPFYISVPSSEDGEYSVNAMAYPKLDEFRVIDLSVRKVWNDGKSTHSSITIELLNDGETVDKVVLSSDNQWKASWKDMPYSDKYSVREASVPSGYKVSYSQKDNEFIVTNSTTLIYTGQLNWPVPILAFGGVLLFAGGWVLFFFKGKKKKNA